MRVSPGDPVRLEEPHTPPGHHRSGRATATASIRATSTARHEDASAEDGQKASEESENDSTFGTVERGMVVIAQAGQCRELPVPHVQQSHSWDCGLASTQMVLRYCCPEKFKPDEFKAVCKNLSLGESIWTIDLAYVVRHYGLGHLMCTRTLGVDTGYSKVRFYTKTICKDELRVNFRFRRAREKAVHVEKRVVDILEVVNHLTGGHVIIVLVNTRLLKCLWCDQKCLQCMWNCCLPSGYYGHFIVLCGYDIRKRLLLYRNPTCRDRVCCITYDCFEEARHCYGTDDDILFVFKDKNR